MHKTTARIVVQPTDGHTIEQWIGMHIDLKREAKLIDGPGLFDGMYLVEVTYQAIGANTEDIMRPYRLRKKWMAIAEVMLVSSQRIQFDE